MDKKKLTPYKEFGCRLAEARINAGFQTAVQAIHALKLIRRTYYSHEAGERMPSDDDICRYADLYGVTPTYLRYGDDAAEQDRGAGRSAKNSLVPSTVLVNQPSQLSKLSASQNYGVRPIVILSAKDIRSLSKGRGVLTFMSRETLPVPEFLAAGPDAFAYIIPPGDFSMIARNGPSFHPGTALVVDPERRIEPGDKVLVDLKDFDAPLLRIYKAVRPYIPGTPFTLSALNEAFDDIRVDDADRVLSIARLIWTGHQW